MPEKAIKNYFGLVVAVAFIALIGFYFSRHQHELFILRNIQPHQLILIAAVTLLSYFCYSLNILIILHQMELKMTFYRWFRVFMISRFLNIFIMQGANVYRSIILKKFYNFPYSKSVSYITFLAWFYAVVTLLVSAFILVFTAPSLTLHGINAIACLVIAAAAIFFLPFPLKNALQRLTPRGEKLVWIKEKIVNITDGFLLIFHNVPLMGKVVALCLVHFVLYFLRVVVTVQALGLNMGMTEIALFSTLLLLSKYFNLIPGNLGLLEILCGYLSRELGYPLSVGILISTLIRVVDYLLVWTIGLVFSKFALPTEIAEEKPDLKQQR